MNQIPDYANDEIYQVLASLCERAGCVITYTDLIEQGAYAQAREFSGIDMPLQNNFSSQDQANLVLAHELAHHLTGGWYVDSEMHNYFNDLPLHWAEEADADRVGAALYKLAELIAKKKAEDAFQEAARKQK